MQDYAKKKNKTNTIRFFKQSTLRSLLESLLDGCVCVEHQSLTLENEGQGQSQSRQQKHGGGRKQDGSPAAAWGPQPRHTHPERSPAWI